MATPRSTRRCATTGHRSRVVLTCFAAAGADLWACVRTRKPEFSAYLDALQEEHGVQITELHLDLSQPDQVKAAATHILKTKKSIDVLVNNAGLIYTAPFLMSSMEKLREQFEVNLFGPLAFTQYIARTMLRQRAGSIINISSSASIEGNPGRSAYASAKAALNTATRVMARELGGAGVRVNAIAPGLTQTEMMASSTSEQAVAETLARMSLQRIAEPNEIAAAALFFASELSSYVTGQVLCVDGGL